MTKLPALAIASAVAGALSLVAAGMAAAAPYNGSLKGKCYGVSKAGENDCANAAKTHDCAGNSTTSYSLGEWKAVADKAACDTLGGVYNTPGKGINPNPK